MMVPDNSWYETACDVFQDSKLFGSLERKIRCALVTECNTIVWEKAQNIDPDENMKYLYIIIEGKLKATQIDPETGRSMVIFLLASGDIFDIFTLLDGKEHIIFPVPITTMKLLRIPLERAREWIREHPQFNEAFLPYLGDRLRRIETYTQSLVFHDTTTRLAHLILHHTNRGKDATQEHYPVHLINNLSHESLAELIGSVRSVVTTQIQKLKEEDILLAERGKLAVKNLEKLLHKCNIVSYRKA